MQVVLAVVLGEGVGGAVEREFSVGDPVCIAADGAAEISFVGDIAVQGVIAQQNVGKPAVAVRRLEANERLCTLASAAGVEVSWRRQPAGGNAKVTTIIATKAQCTGRFLPAIPPSLSAAPTPERPLRAEV